MSAIVRVSRFIAWAGLTGVGALHAAWAAGSSWPAKSDKELARAVAGDKRMPDPEPTAGVAAAALVGGAIAGGAMGEGALPVALRRGAGLVLLARGALGGNAALALLGRPEGGKRFVELDNRYYRPLCAVLGFALLVGARNRER